YDRRPAQLLQDAVGKRSSACSAARKGQNEKRRGIVIRPLGYMLCDAVSAFRFHSRDRLVDRAACATLQQYDADRRGNGEPSENELHATRRPAHRLAAESTPGTSRTSVSARFSSSSPRTSSVKAMRACRFFDSVLTAVTLILSRENTSEISRSSPWRSIASTTTSTGKTSSRGLPQSAVMSRSGCRAFMRATLLQLCRWFELPVPRVT